MRKLAAFALAVAFGLTLSGSQYANAATSPLWIGTWKGNLTTKIVAGSLPNSITYTAVKGPTQASGSCQTTGMKAVCSWTEKYSPSYTVEMVGHQVLILAGNTIVEHKVYDNARCDSPGVAACEAAARKIKGLVKNTRWSRV